MATKRRKLDPIVDDADLGEAEDDEMDPYSKLLATLPPSRRYQSLLNQRQQESEGKADLSDAESGEEDAGGEEGEEVGEEEGEGSEGEDGGEDAADDDAEDAEVDDDADGADEDADDAADSGDEENDDDAERGAQASRRGSREQKQGGDDDDDEELEEGEDDEEGQQRAAMRAEAAGVSDDEEDAEAADVDMNDEKIETRQRGEEVFDAAAFGGVNDAAAAKSDPYVAKYTHVMTDAEVAKAQASLAGSGIKLRKVEYPALREHLFTDLPALPAAPAAIGSLSAYGLSNALVQQWRALHNLPTDDASAQAASAKSAKASKRKRDSKVDAKESKAASAAAQTEDLTHPLHRALLPLLNNYVDVWCSNRTIHNAKHLQQLYMLHALNHVFKTRARVLKNNERARVAEKSEKGEAATAALMTDPTMNDQGFTRAKVLIIVPFRNSAYAVVQTLLSLLPEKHKQHVLHKARLDEQFGPSAELKVKDRTKPADFLATFDGNIDDCFLLGVALQNKAVRLFANLYQSDFIIASPLGLRMLVGTEGDNPKHRDYDMLSSIEMVVMDQADVFSLQNWAHVEAVLNATNRMPQQAHDTDFSRVRQWYLNGHAKYYRQMLIFSSYANVDLTALFRRAAPNSSGHVSVRPQYTGTVANVIPVVRQIFQRIDCTSLVKSDDERFNAFARDILPKVKALSDSHIMIFVPSYFDFVRVRNLFRSKHYSFVGLSEYARTSDVSRGRSDFFHGKRQFMLLTERAQFFHRFKIRGIRHLVFYALPDNAQFYSELLNLLETGAQIKPKVKPGQQQQKGAAADDEDDAVESGENSVLALFTKYDALQLERVVGSERAARLLQANKGIHMFC